MLICIEGMDGVGKTTITKYLSQKYNIPLEEKAVKNLLGLTVEQNNKIKEKLYTLYSSKMQAWYYLMGYMSVIEDSKNKNLIVDRGFLSTYYFSYDEQNKLIFDVMAQTEGFPDLTIVLYATIEERISRIKNRNGNDKDLQKTRLYKDNYQKYFEAIKKYNIPSIIINTEFLSMEETQDIISKIVEKILVSDTDRERIISKFSLKNFSVNYCLTYEEIYSIVNNINQREMQNVLKIERKKNENIN